MTQRLAKIGMKQSNVFKILFEIMDELRSESYFGDEQNDGLLFGESMSAKLDVDIGFA